MSSEENEQKHNASIEQSAEVEAPKEKSVMEAAAEALDEEYNRLIAEEKKEEPKEAHTKESVEVEEKKEAKPEVAQESVVEDLEKPKERVYTEVEKRAMEKGWVPPEEFDEDKDFRSAETYLAIEPYIQKISKERKRHDKEVQELREQLGSVKKTVDSSRLEGYKQALEDIKNKRRAAIEYGDAEVVENLDEQFYKLRNHIDDLEREEAPRQAVEQAEQSQQPVEEPKTVTDFKRRNADWFDSNHQIRAEFELFASDKLQSDPSWRVDDPVFLAMCERHLQKSFPDYFRNQKAKEAPAVSSGTPNAARPKPKLSVNDLTDNQKIGFEIAKEVDPDLTLEQFIKEVNDLNNRI